MSHYPLCGAYETAYPPQVSCPACIVRITELETLATQMRAATAAIEEQRRVIISVQLDGTIRLWCLICRWEAPHPSGVMLFDLARSCDHACADWPMKTG